MTSKLKKLLRLFRKLASFITTASLLGFIDNLHIIASAVVECGKKDCRSPQQYEAKMALHTILSHNLIKVLGGKEC